MDSYYGVVVDDLSQVNTKGQRQKYRGVIPPQAGRCKVNGASGAWAMCEWSIRIINRQHVAPGPGSPENGPQSGL